MKPAKHQPTVFDAMASPEAIGRAMLLGDSNAWRLSQAEQVAAVSDALADYAARPAPSITLYSDGIAVIEAAAAEPDTAYLLGASNPREILIAHELYHHIETVRPECQVSRRWKVTLIRLGRWRWRSGFPVLSEIAAGAFAQTLLRLPAHPHLLDLAVVKAVTGRASAEPGSRIGELCRGALPDAGAGVRH
jgi:hypothetical protein